MKTDLIKKIITAMCVAVIVATFGAVLVGCGEDSLVADIPDNIPNKLLDSEVAPDDVVAATAKVSIVDIVNDASLTTAQKIQKIMSATEQNEITAERFNYFQYKTGSTEIDGKSGTLIYQRHRKQNQKDKDDTTLKRAINANFGATELNFVQSSMIRLVYNDAIYRIQGAVADVNYDSTTGLLVVADDATWSKGDNFGGYELVEWSQNLDETKKTCANWECEGIVSEEGATINRVEQDGTGDVYYELKFTVDTAVANADSATIDRLENDNSGKDMSVGKLEVTAQVWECGLMKFYQTDETWSGEIGKRLIGDSGIWYKGSADSQSYTWYSYTERDNDMSESIAILNSML